MADLVFWICLFVGCTAVPMTVDLLRTFFPASTGRSGRSGARERRARVLRREGLADKQGFGADL